MKENKKLSDVIGQQDFASLYPSKSERILETIKSNLENEYELLELKNLLDEECRKIFNIDFYRNMLIELIGIDKMIPIIEGSTFKVYIKSDKYNIMTIELGIRSQLSEDGWVLVTLFEDEYLKYNANFTKKYYTFTHKDTPINLRDLIESLTIIGK